MEEAALIIVSSRKPVMNYVTACLTAFNSGHRRVVLRARGRSISSAVDVVNLLKAGFLPGLRTERVSVGSEDVDGGEDRVSFIEIEVSRS
ncbi:MAG: RNA-binding protein [Conexivisphaera sp.]